MTLGHAYVSQIPSSSSVLYIPLFGDDLAYAHPKRCCNIKMPIMPVKRCNEQIRKNNNNQITRSCMRECFSRLKFAKKELIFSLGLLRQVVNGCYWRRRSRCHYKVRRVAFQKVKVKSTNSVLHPSLVKWTPSIGKNVYNKESHGRLIFHFWFKTGDP